MRRKRKSVVAAVLCALSMCLTSSVVYAAETETNAYVDDLRSENGVNSENSENRIKEIVSSMTTEQKLSQMMVVALRSNDDNNYFCTEITAEYEDLLKAYDFGGIILFAANILDPAQTVSLIRQAQEAASSSDLGIPMLVCVDQEGGIVNRVSFGTTGPGNMAMAAAGDPAYTEEIAGIMGSEIAALGFNVDFAPVADVNSNPNNPIIGVRSFSDDPAMVSEHVRAFIKGLKKEGVMSALKHFPGHGNVGSDSHTGLPKSEFSLEEIQDLDLIPFQEGIDAGAEMIMTAHIQYPKIEQESYLSKQDGQEVFLPATLSHTILTDILRGQMGFEGLITTDAMDMGAIGLHFDPTDASVLAINAGADILLCSMNLYAEEGHCNFDAMAEYMQSLLDRVKSGEISEARLDESVSRILKMKSENGHMDADFGPLDEQDGESEKRIQEVLETVGSAEHHAREWEIAEKALTLLKNDGRMLPLDGRDGSHTLILYPVPDREASLKYALEKLEKEGSLDPSTVSCLCCQDLSAEEILEAMKSAENVLILSQSTGQNQEISDALSEYQGKSALICLKLPYDSAYYETDAVLCAYQHTGSAHDAEGNGPINLNVAVALMSAFGRSVPEGYLPVNVMTFSEESFTDEVLYERGFGLEIWGD